MKTTMNSRLVGVFALAVTCGLGCSSATQPQRLPPAVLISNATCVNGQCKTLEIRAFVWAFKVPQLPTGLEVLGEVHPASACLTFPSSWTFRVYGPSDTTVFTWTPDNPEGVFLIAVDSALFHGGGTAAQRDSSTRGLGPYDGTGLGTVGRTPTFIPASNAGWGLDLPNRTPAIKRIDACQL